VLQLKYGVAAEVRLYDRLFTVPAPESSKDGRDYKDFLNPDSLRTVTHCMVEPALAGAEAGERFGEHSTLVFNRVVTLRDSWAKIEQQQNP
jgi:glutaminyl-tRNA synthetase